MLRWLVYKENIVKQHKGLKLSILWSQNGYASPLTRSDFFRHKKKHVFPS